MNTHNHYTISRNKNIFYFLFFLLITCFTSFSQTGFNYQAIIRDVNSNVLADQQVYLKIELMSGNVPFFTEVHDVKTNDFGLINVVVGNGTGNDDFSSLDWSKNYDIRISINGDVYDTAPLQRVPYAKYANNGITSEQAGEIAANTAKTGINIDQIYAIKANTIKMGITQSQLADIIANTAKKGITTTQSDAITSNTTKVSAATSSEIGYLSGLTGGIQTQIDANQTQIDAKQSSFTLEEDSSPSVESQFQTTNGTDGSQRGQSFTTGSVTKILSSITTNAFGGVSGNQLTNGVLASVIKIRKYVNDVETGSSHALTGEVIATSTGSPEILGFTSEYNPSGDYYPNTKFTFDGSLTLEANTKYVIEFCKGSGVEVYCKTSDVYSGGQGYDIDGINLTHPRDYPFSLSYGQKINQTATASELNLLDGVTASTAELNLLDGVTASAAELNLLDGVTATSAELNYLDGVTSAIQTQLNAAGGASNITGLSDASVQSSSMYIGNVPSSSSGASTNIGIGKRALNAITTGDNNAAVGYDALKSNTTGNNNVAIGEDALYKNTSGSNNIAIGYNALEKSTVEQYNIAIGVDALKNNTTGGWYNNAVGYHALMNNTTAKYNNAFGRHALYNTTTGKRNSGFGNNVLETNTIGNYNVAMGYDAGERASTGSGNTLIGYESMNIYAVSNYNSALGYQSLKTMIDGDYNAAIGYQAGDRITTGSNNTIIGSKADPSSSNAYNQIVIGYNATGQYDNSVTLGNADVTRVYAAQDGDATLYANGIHYSSDARLKENIKSLTHGLDFIMNLNPVSYMKMKIKDFLHSSSEEPENKKFEIGLLAQEVEEASVNLGFKNKIVSVGEDGIYRMDYSKIIMPLVKGMQEQQEMIESLREEIEILKSKMD